MGIDLKKKHLRYDLLLVSLFSLDSVLMLVFDSLHMALVLMGGFWGCLLLLRGWRFLVRICRERLDRNGSGRFLASPIFPWRTTGTCLWERRKDAVVSSWFGEGMSWLSRLCSIVSSSVPGELSINSCKQNFSFHIGQESTTVGKILLVEDTEINRILLRKLIKGHNLLLDEAENGQIAVNYCKQGNKYDLVFMDKEMPVMDGHEATRQLRSLGVKTPIVALTGNSLQSDRDMFFQAGADEFCTKPLSRAGLVQLLARYGLNKPDK